MMGVYFAIIPFLLRTHDGWTSFPMKLLMCVLIVVLDWFSFHEDISRYSEEEICIFGNCRFNARITGHLAHWADVFAIGWLLKDETSDMFEQAMLGIVLVIYGVLGSLGIEHYTRDGSDSDLRKGDHMPTIMPPIWRGALNDFLNVVLIITAWQSILMCRGGECRTEKYSSLFPLNQVWYNVYRPKGAWNKTKGFVNVVFAVAPLAVSYINTTAQHDTTSTALYKIGISPPPAGKKDEIDTKE